MTRSTLTLLACCWWAASFSLSPSSGLPVSEERRSGALSERLPTPWMERIGRETQEALRLLNDPLLLALREVESSAGADCKPSRKGALGCLQILPATAQLEDCADGWDGDGPPAFDCADKWLARGERLCRRWDVYGAARWYYRGECLQPGARPWAYEMDVARERLKHL